MLGASKTEPVAERAGLAGREPKRPGVVVPLAGFVLGAKAEVEEDVPVDLLEAPREKPGACATVAFSFAMRSASSLSYLADHSALVSSSES